MTLIGVKRCQAGSPLLLNPGPDFKLAYDDICFYMAITSEEDMLLKEKPSKPSKSHPLRKESDWGSFVSVIDPDEEAKHSQQGIF